MKLLIESIHERDMDLLLMREILDNTRAGKWFITEACGNGYEPISVQHSKYDETGEADIAVILQGNNEKIELFVEDKIDAAPQPQQHDRYIQRGELAVRNEECNRYIIVLFAPNRYLNSSQAAGYTKTISYEAFQQQCPSDSYACQLIDEAIKKEDNGYVPVRDDKVTAFWQDYYEYVAVEYPNLRPNINPGDHSSQSVWFTFKTFVPDTKIKIKADRGYTDLEIGNYVNQRKQFIEDNKELIRGFQLADAGKSLAVRLSTPKIDFHKPFVQQIDAVNECLDVVAKLYDLSEKLQIRRKNK